MGANVPVKECLFIVNKERGTINWNLIMLPNHVEILKDVLEKPILYEQQIMEINMTLQHAIKNNLTVRIECFYEYNEHKIEGKMLNADMMKGFLMIY